MNIFSCVANTYGANCQNRPIPCTTFNKCQNGGSCSYNATSAMMACTCPAKYNGEGCEWLRDLCNTDNPCKNNAECGIIQDNYKCACKAGYTGTNCETEINECSGRTRVAANVSMPSTSTTVGVPSRRRATTVDEVCS